jgi:hypothetical protein
MHVLDLANSNARRRAREVSNSNKMAKAKKVCFKYAFGNFFKSHELLKLIDVYQLFCHQKIFTKFYITTDIETPSISAFVLQW